MECNGWIPSGYLPCGYNHITDSYEQSTNIWYSESVPIIENITPTQVSISLYLNSYLSGLHLSGLFTYLDACVIIYRESDSLIWIFNLEKRCPDEWESNILELFKYYNVSVNEVLIEFW